VSLSGEKADNSHSALLYNEAVWEVLVEQRGLAQAIVFARAATIGTQRFPVHWGGDVDSKFSGLAETIRGGLSLGLSGFGYHSSDIGGFKSEGKAGGDSGAVPPGAV
jgi:alpha-D-xyloside xylohydrolase